MIDHLLKFFKTRYNPGHPVLLAFSGGPDSLALFHLLIDLQKTHPLQFAIAHVDHGWRDESSQEASTIAGMTENHGILAHFKLLDPKALNGNLEAACREERLRFFASLCKHFGYQAVLLAHHADDVAETVLKRAFEGASFSQLNALKPELILHGVPIWRPLLAVSKKQILAWLDQKGLQGFSDRTNADTKFLRARLRVQVLPYLSELYGKEVSSSLCRMAEEAAELKEHLDERVAPFLSKMIFGKMGSFLDLHADLPQTLLELKHLIRQFCSLSASFTLSRESLNRAAECLKNREANKMFAAGKKKAEKYLHVDRGCLLIPLNKENPIACGDWEIQESSCDLSEKKPSNWKHLWCDGIGEVILPKGNYELAAPHAALAKWWTANKVPSYLRNKIPILVEKGQFKHEFLTGRCQPSSQMLTTERMLLRIRLNP